MMNTCHANLRGKGVLKARNPPRDSRLSLSGSAHPLSSSNQYEYALATSSDSRASNEENKNVTKGRRFVRSCDSCHESKLKCDERLPRCSFCESRKNQCTFTKILTMRSCDNCRKRKLRCYGSASRCYNCEKSNIQCLRALNRKKRAPPKNAKYISDLESKLASVENFLRSEGLLIEVDGKVDFDLTEHMLHERRHQYAQRGSTPQILPKISWARLASIRSARARCTVFEIAAKGIDTALTPGAAVPVGGDLFSTSKISTHDPGVSPCGTCFVSGLDCSIRRCGTSSINEPTCCTMFAQRVRELVGDDESKSVEVAAHEANEFLVRWTTGAYNDAFSHRTFVQLPEKQTCFVLLQEFFEYFQPLYPIFHRDSFMNKVHEYYDSASCQDISVWASLNAILAIAYRMRVTVHPVNVNEDRCAWNHFKNAITATSGFIVRSAELASVQTCLALTLFLQGTRYHESSRSLITTAIRISQSIGLHRDRTKSHLDQVTAAQQKIVFWIAYILDKRMCLQSGLPAAQNDDDMEIDLPTEKSFEVLSAHYDPTFWKTMSLFLQRCKFAQIQSQVYRLLYVAKASSDSTAKTSRNIEKLDRLLQEWRKETHDDFKPGQVVQPNGKFLHVHVLVLHLAYYDCLTLVHSRSSEFSYQAFSSSKSDYEELQDEQWYHQNATSRTICLSAIEASISLTRSISLVLQNWSRVYV